MPTLHLHTNIPQDETSFAEFAAKATELLSKALKKNASYTQVVHTPSMVVFGAQPGPSAVVNLYSAGLTQEQIDGLIAPLSRLLERHIGAPPPATYIHFHSTERARSAWNGRTLKRAGD